MSFLYKQTIIKLTTAQLEKILEETNLAALAPIDVRPLKRSESSAFSSSSSASSSSPSSSLHQSNLNNGLSVSAKTTIKIKRWHNGLKWNEIDALHLEARERE